MTADDTMQAAGAKDQGPGTSRGIFRSWRDGARRVHSAPAIIFGVWLLSLLLALPLGLVLRGLIRESLGASLAANAAAAGVNYDWWNEFLQQTGGIGATFVPSIIGFAAPLRNISDLADNAPLAATIAALIVVWLVLWAFIAGGIFDRYARGRTTHTPAFFAACGVFFFRFLRLGAFAWLAYWALFRYVHGWIFVTLWRRWTENLTIERDAFWIRLALYAVFASVLALVNLVVDYAKVRAVVEDRRSMIGALAGAVRFVVRHPRATVGLYLLNTAVFVLILLVYRAGAPGAGWSGAGVWLAFLVTQIYIAARVWAKLVFAASQIDLFQRRLAHAGFAAFPETAQLEPPIVETIGPPAVPPPIQP